jgi:DNA-binding beta-propeller fold protein YncE/transcriptional regulator with XRE-family HTH domain
MTVQKDTPFGVQLRQYRSALGLTQEELAEQARLSPRGIRALERGERTAPRRDTVDLLADALQLGADDRLSFQAASRAIPAREVARPPAPTPASNRPRWRVRPPMLLRAAVIGALILVAAASAYSARALIHVPHSSHEVVGVVSSQWPHVTVRFPLLTDPVAVATDAGGELYVLDARNNLIHTFASDGTPLATWGGTGTANGEFLAPSALAVDTSGRVYVADTGNSRVQVFSSSGRWRASWTGQGETPIPLRSPSGIAVGPGGQVYVSDAPNGRILVFSSTGHLASAAALMTQSGPTSLAIGTRGIIYVLTGGGIEALSLQGAVLHQWPRADTDTLAVDGRGSVWGVGGGWIDHFTARGFLLGRTHLSGSKDPEGIGFDGQSTMYLADPGAGQIEKIAPPSRIITRFGGSRPRSAPSGAPSAVVTDEAGNVYVARAGGRIEEYSPAGDLIHVRILPGASPVSALRAMAVDSHGTLLAVDTAASQVWEIAPDGAVLHRWGRPGAGHGALSVPSGVAVDWRGRIYVADTGNARVQVFSHDGHFLYAIGLRMYAGDAGIDPYPFGLAIDAHGDLYVADALLDTIFKLSPRGRLLTRIGSSGSKPGRLRSPQAVAIDREGRIYVADTGNNRVQVFSPAGALLQVMTGSGRRGWRFDRPSGVAVDQFGSVYLANTGGNRIEKFVPAADAATPS